MMYLRSSSSIFSQEFTLCYRDTINKNSFQDWEFDDGSPPPPEIVQDWFHLLKTRFSEDPGCCVAVHCVAGLGRLVSLVLFSCLLIMWTSELTKRV